MKHKTAIASAASIAGVLLAGATALGANLGIVNSSDQLGELSAVSETVATQPTVPGTSTTTEAGPELIAYQIPEVGIVTIARSDDAYPTSKRGLYRTLQGSGRGEAGMQKADCGRQISECCARMGVRQAPTGGWPILGVDLGP